MQTLSPQDAVPTAKSGFREGFPLKTVLILAVNFPPYGGVGVIRTLKFTKYLPEFGWMPLVVTIPAQSAKRVSDDSLLNEIPPGVDIHRPFFRDYRKIIPGDIARLLQPVLRRIHFPDKYIQWNHFALKYIKEKILPHRSIDLAYTSVGPHSTLLLAHTVKQQLNIPFVVDFRDPFSFSQYSILDARSSWRSKAEEIEQAVLKDAAHVINVSALWKNKYESLYPEIAGKSSLIHNGYDEEDFSAAFSAPQNDVFTIGYNGTFSRIVPLDPLVSAIVDIHRTYGIPIRLRIATPTNRKKLISKYPYLVQNDLLDYSGFLPHRASLENLASCNISALVLNDMEATEGMIPAKTFEYLRIERPILLLHRKNGFLAEIIERTGTGVTVDIADPQAIVDALLKLQRAWRDNSLAYQPNFQEIRKFERRYLTQKLAEIFNALA